MAPLAYFGIESSGFSLVVNLLILFLAVLYFSLIYWTYQDARRRIADPVMIGLATFVACFPFVGPIIYMILRPPEYLDDVRERELELETAEARLAQVHRGQCPYCDYRIEREFVRCPSCLRKLKERCANCSRPLDQAWTICPYCEADVPGVSSPRVRRRRAAEEELAPPYERPLAPDEEPEPALAGSEAAATAAERRSERRAAERQAGVSARTAAAGRRPRPAP
jgi:Double zinc ribbon